MELDHVQIGRGFRLLSSCISVNNMEIEALNRFFRIYFSLCNSQVLHEIGRTGRSHCFIDNNAEIYLNCLAQHNPVNLQ